MTIKKFVLVFMTSLIVSVTVSFLGVKIMNRSYSYSQPELLYNIPFAETVESVNKSCDRLREHAGDALTQAFELQIAQIRYNFKKVDKDK